MALVSNLKSEEYVTLILGSLDHLPVAFAKLDQEHPDEMNVPSREHRNSQLYKIIKKFIKEEKERKQQNEAPQVPSKTPQTLSTPSLENIDKATDEINRLPKEILQGTTKITISKEKKRVNRDSRLPPIGTVLERFWKKRKYRIDVIEEGFVLGRKLYRTLSEAAKKITGKPQSVFKFFGLRKPWEEQVLNLEGRRLNRFTMVILPIATES